MDEPLFRDGDRVCLPAPAALLPCRSHPESEGITAHHVQWVRRSLPFLEEPQLQSLLGAHYDRWVCMCFPDIARDIAEDLTNLVTLMFLADDLTSRPGRDTSSVTHTRAAYDALLDVMQGTRAHPRSAGQLPVSLLTLAGELFGSIRARMPTTQWHRWANNMRAWAEGAIQETAVRRRGKPLSFAEYLTLRRHSVCVTPWCVLGEYGLGIDLSAIAEHPAFRDLIGAVTDHALLTNDLHSFRAEHYNGDDINVIAVLCRAEGLSLQGAVDRTSMMIHDAEHSFIQQRERIRSSSMGSTAEMHVYFQALGHLLAGNTRWSYLTGRYHGNGYEWNGALSGTITLTPDCTVRLQEGTA
ncbi:terpene synthase family protein [Streptomyces sp. NPDC059003]|uniref:terpene synthase family protein n=1 Tax=Streptomyces sp. NPDC059003 TaxID=3346691 RepID=UPI0036D12EDB